MNAPSDVSARLDRVETQLGELLAVTRGLADQQAAARRTRDELLADAMPVLTGLSRKRMIAGVLEEGTDAVDRDGGSAAAAVICAMKGARIIRAHNVRATWEAMQVVRATLEEGHV